MNIKHDSLDSIIQELQPLTDVELAQWLIKALNKQSPEIIHLPTRGSKHSFIENLYKKCDPLLQEKLGRGLALVLERFEPNLTPVQGQPEYLFSLLSLASVIRNEQIKERLRRWLYLGAFRDWRYDASNLYGQLILSTSRYDSDRTWLEFLLRSLPAKSYFRDVAVETYRAVLDTRELESLELLYDVVTSIDPDDEDTFKRFLLFLTITKKKFGFNPLLAHAVRVLDNRERDVAKVCFSVLRFEDFLEGICQDPEHFMRCGRELDVLVWQPAINRLFEIDDEETQTETLSRILMECEYYRRDVASPQIAHMYRQTKIVFRFRGTHEIAIDKKEIGMRAGV